MRSIGEVSIAQAKPGLVHQRRRLKRVPRLFPCHLLRVHAAQCPINQRQQFISGFGIAVLDGLKDARDVAHVDPGSQEIRPLAPKTQG